MKYDFESLLLRAIQDWPEEVDLSNLHGDSDGARYTVEGLGVLSDSISEKYIDQADEVIFRSLHWSIYGALHSAARLVLKVRPRDLREAIVKERFEAHLRNGMNIPEVGFSLADIRMCETYFDAEGKRGQLD